MPGWSTEAAGAPEVPVLAGGLLCALCRGKWSDAIVAPATSCIACELDETVALVVPAPAE
jgi:hypothetical protein